MNDSNDIPTEAQPDGATVDGMAGGTEPEREAAARGMMHAADRVADRLGEFTGTLQTIVDTQQATTEDDRKDRRSARRWRAAACFAIAAVIALSWAGWHASRSARATAAAARHTQVENHRTLVIVECAVAPEAVTKEDSKLCQPVIDQQAANGKTTNGFVCRIEAEIAADLNSQLHDPACKS